MKSIQTVVFVESTVSDLVRGLHFPFHSWQLNLLIQVPAIKREPTQNKPVAPDGGLVNLTKSDFRYPSQTPGWPLWRLAGYKQKTGGLS